MIERALAIVGFATLVVTAAGIALIRVSLRSDRAKSAARVHREVQASDAILAYMEHERALVRGRIHHRLGHPVIQSSIDELIGCRVVDV
jgi:uncharacterized membrane protein